MDLSITDDLLNGEYEFPDYSGAFGYYHLLKQFAIGINFGFIDRYYRNIFALFESSLNTKYFTPYLAVGVTRSSIDVGNCTGFFSTGIQAQIFRTAPFFSGNHIKLNYYKENIFSFI